MWFQLCVALGTGQFNPSRISNDVNLIQRGKYNNDDRRERRLLGGRLLRRQRAKMQLSMNSHIFSIWSIKYPAKNWCVVLPGRWHNGSAFVFCSCGCTFESEPSPTSAHACGEVTGCAPVAKRSASVAKIVNKAEPTLALKPRGDVTRNPKQGYQWPQKRTCVRQKLYGLLFCTKIHTDGDYKMTQNDSKWITVVGSLFIWAIILK